MTGDWTTANQRFLTAHLARVHARLEGRDTPAPRWDETTPPALAELERMFGLSAFERDVVLLCAGVELDAAFAESVRQRGGATFGLALAAFPDAHWSALSPGAPLRFWRLVLPGAGDTLAGAPLRIDERVLHFLAGVGHLDEGLEGYAAPVAHAETPGEMHSHLADEIGRAWQQAGGALPVVQLVGPDAAARLGVAFAVCQRLGLGLFRLAADVLPAAPDAAEVLRRLWTREAMLSRAALVVDADMADGPDAARRVARFAEGVGGPVFISRERPHAPGECPTLTFAVGRPPRREQQQAWQALLGEAGAGLNGHLDRVTAQFTLDAPALRAAALQVQARAATGEAPGEALWEACRSQVRMGTGGLARRIEAHAAWDDLVLPEAQKTLLRDLVAHVRQHVRVFETWGFGRKSPRGTGVTALFAGPSGTGKTMAAEVVAGALQLDLLHVDLSQVVSKYIGETEKNLGRVFDEAEAGGAILLFDEADALFGKRSEVKDSHDRYANLEVSYLLQRMEAYRGLAILTTNLKKSLDDAFQRRLRFVVTFPFPDAAARADIWRRTIPAETPTDGLAYDRLAQLNASGGTIHNVALHAAFLAADADAPLAMPHLLAAARRVYAKREQPLTDAEIRGWT